MSARLHLVGEDVPRWTFAAKSDALTLAALTGTDDEGSVIMVYGWEQRSLDGKAAPEYQTFRWRVDMTRINGELKMTNFEWVT